MKTIAYIDLQKCFFFIKYEKLKVNIIYINNILYQYLRTYIKSNNIGHN